MKRVVSFIIVVKIIFSLYPVPVVATNTVAFRSPSDIKAGDFITFGSFDNIPILWKVVDVNGNQFKLFSAQTLFYGEMDANVHQKITSSGFTTTVLEGDSNWSSSDIRRYLNSDDATVSYKNESPSYASKHGFLTNFTSSEKAIILNTTHKSLVHVISSSHIDGGTGYTINADFYRGFTFSDEAYNSLYYENTTEKFFLMDAMDLKLAKNNGIYLYNDYYWSNNSNRYIENSSGGNYLTRTPSVWLVNGLTRAYYYGMYYLYIMHTNARGENLIKGDNVAGIRPACYIQLENTHQLTGDGSLENPYSIIYNTTSCTIAKGKYNIHVVDENGAPIKDATVSYDGVTNQTDPCGNADFDFLTEGTPSIEVKKDGYGIWNNSNSNWKKNENRYEIVVLYPEAYSDYKLKEATYSNYSNMSFATNLLVSTKKLNLKLDGVYDLDFGNFYLICDATEPDKVTSYELWQGSNQIAVSPNGNFGKLSVTSFSKGGGCFVRVNGKDGAKTDTRINLEFAENTINKETSFSLKGKGLSLKIKDDVPFIGGSTLNFDLPITDLPINWTFSENKTKIAINLALKQGKPYEEQFKEYKKTLEQAANYSKAKWSKQNANIFKRLVQKNNKADFFQPWTFTFGAYFEQSVGSSTAEGYVAILAHADFVDIEYNTVVVVVPVTVQIGVDFSLEFGAKGSYDADSGTISGNVMLNPTFGLTAFGGIGASKFVGVGAYGSADLETKFNMFGTERGVRSIDLTGELGLKAYLGPLVYEKPFAHNTWHLYTADTVYGSSQASATSVWISGINDPEQYTLADLSYLADESGWLGGDSLEQGILMEAPTVARTEFSNLLTDTYRNAQPTMVSIEQGLYAAFVRADQSTGERYVVVTKFDGDTWASPVRVDESSIFDDAPQLCADECGNLWLAYARTVSDPGSSLLTYAKNQVIVIGSVDPETLAFTEQKTYSGNYSHLQQLSLIQGSPTLAWVDSSVTDESSVLSPESGVIQYAKISEETWSDAMNVASVDASIDSLTLGTSDGVTAIAFTSGQTLFCAKVGGEPKMIAENVTGRVSYGLLPGADEAAFLWNAENALISSDGSTVTADGMSHEYAIVGSRIYYSMTGEDEAELAAIQYSNGSWSLPMLLTADGRYLENLSAARWNEDDYIFGMTTAVEITQDSVEDAKNLVWSVVRPIHDLRLEDVSYDDEGLSGGDVTSVILTVTNVGEQTVNSICVFANGTPLQTSDCSLTPGESIELTVQMECPEALSDFEISVDEPGEEDYHPKDNACELRLGYADVQTVLTCQEIGLSRSLVATVTNIGVEPASGKVTFYDSENHVLGAEYLSSLAVGETFIATLTLDADYFGDAFVQVRLDQEELREYNNDDAIYLSRQEVGIKNIRKTGSTVEVDALAQSEGVQICCAWYDSYGRMLKLVFQPLSAGVMTQLSFEIGDPAYTLKLFALDNEGLPLCPARIVE